MPNKVKGRQGEELCVYVPEGKIAEVDRARGPYFTRSKFVLLALDKTIEEVNSGILKIEKAAPQGAVAVPSLAPSGKASVGSNTESPNPAHKGAGGINDYVG
jgi:hypothetical protein